MAVELRVGHVSLKDTARGGVPVLGGHHVAGVLLDDLPALAAAHGRHGLGQVRDRLADGGGVRGFDRAPLGFVGERPHGGHRLGGAEGQVDARRPAAGGARPAQEPSRPRVLAFHQRDEVSALDGGALDPETGERVGARKPLAGCLGGLPVGAQVVVPALWLDGL